MSLFLIAEVGINHNGDIEIAKRLIDAAHKAGFDAVKFQKRNVDRVYTKGISGQSAREPLGQHATPPERGP